jgi:hydroxypyruvate reductase
MRKDAEKIYTGAISASMPGEAVRSALRLFIMPKGRLIIVSIGKAAWQMAKAAMDFLGLKSCTGAVITKYRHSLGELSGLEIYEAAHPVPDAAGIAATERVLELTANLCADDCVLFLVSGGGSALFESPICTQEQLSALTESLLRSGAEIGEINAVRKHISKVKGGRFAEHVYPGRIFSVVLSDVLGDRLDVIASGPAVCDSSTVSDVLEIFRKYNISFPEEYLSETPKQLTGVETVIGGSVRDLAKAAEKIAAELGYEAHIISVSECGEARLLGERIGMLAREKSRTGAALAYIFAGETVVKVKGQGKGGRNQEVALAAAPLIAGIAGASVFSVGSDGTDGPTDAAGGYVDGQSYDKMLSLGIDPISSLDNNDAYNALARVGGLIFTGPTGTNVNDISVLLIK